ncbi:MAG: hypothetical protein CGU29_11760 [Candidatus Dactylopiibacterium carminicum]|uniref:Uncharacterized protein n=1 Tax=Candidatus Dactylopiibacterium carminicum TaxID=857335 RepID=A0A272EQN6_9RHOO|nr:hypothetical protein [Candidatus Dactylopiibacterium carminicum]KAF7598636.1 hypothetical protein BGI27_12205 [Candidatus Dactylopiibacterium carminicum]PAS92402.1 MAG: hypothetical protein CGU29_11760 [Candidatus Dactylopiibacterium carminicum]PAS98403.1 MAG: hypothetical protein BSR46_12220 [Candidatus Dactylopiibacterium carminicum]
MSFLRTILLSLGVIATCTSHASEPVSFSFRGCSDAQNRPVPAVAEAALPTLFGIGSTDGQPVIRYNPERMPQLLPETRAFLFAHECARIRLNLADGERSPAQAERADCWAANTLLRSGLIKDAKDLEAIATDLSLVGDEWPQLPGPARTLKLSSCSPVRGGVALPQGQTASPQWNACMQACGSRLYACGRSPDCVAVFNQCTAGCGK